MTLVILVKCQDGYILASDRKATDASSGETQEAAKSKVERGWAIGGAGNASAIQRVFYELEDVRLSPENVETKVVDVLNQCNQVQRIKVQCVLLTVRDGTIRPRLIQPSEYGVFPTHITSIMECYGETGPKAVAKHYLKGRGNYEGRQCAHAAAEVLTILKEASEEGTYVGEQTEYGFDLVLFKNGSYCHHPRVTAEWGILSSEYRSIDGAVPNFIFTEFEAGAE